MAKKIAMDVWKFLSRELTYEQKKEMILKKNIQIGSLRTQSLSNDSKLKMAISMFDSELSKSKVQKSMLSYYVGSIVPDVQKDLDEKAIHINELIEMDISKIVEIIQERGHFYVLIALIKSGQVEKVNQLIKEIVMNKEKFKEQESSETLLIEEQLNSALMKVTELNKSIELLNVSEKKVKKAHKALEMKYSEMLEKKNKEIKKFENKLEELIIENNNLTLYSNTLLEESKVHFEVYGNLEEETIKMKKRNHELELEYSYRKSEEEMKDDHYLVIEKEKTINNNKKRILVFGDVPIIIQRNAQYDISIFDGDCQNYNFEGNYDEHWYIEDKLTAKEKQQLTKNKKFSTINWNKTSYKKTLVIQ
ncbi:hypothetical protein I2483_09970 [Sporosarcina sp. E16_3]|uniref:hypothetical protein n=1 Tax=Sporosarcina sp. E16_3 TaxID=2789293 RepID=UPI001A9223D3|nr:hypothetical protein [Sporosarcina sp. E16_3]MBO0601989.1 hypothetical protein [Sporosarcina sp. E16_3]